MRSRTGEKLNGAQGSLRLLGPPARDNLVGLVVRDELLGMVPGRARRAGFSDQNTIKYTMDYLKHTVFLFHDSKKM